MINKLKSGFVNQSVLFLNLYKEMNENNKFKNYKNSFELLEQYNRRIYHNKLECKYMRNDYVEETIHENTGVFF